MQYEIPEKCQKQHHTDAEQAKQLEKLEICTWPLDIPSLERQLWFGYEEPFLSDGYTWADKKHRTVGKAIEEIRQLRTRVLELENCTNTCKS